MKKIVHAVTLTGILCIAFIARLYPYITKPFWEDELYTYNFATNVTGIVQQFLHPIDDRPPLLYLFISELIKMNTSEWFLRLPGLIASVAAVVVLYLAFRKTDRRFALVLLFLSSISLFQIELSWQLRDYSYLILITALGIYQLHAIHTRMTLNEKPRLLHGVTLGVICLLGVLTNHIFTPFFISLIAAFWVVWFIKFKLQSLAAIRLMALSLLFPLIVSGAYLRLQSATVNMTTSWIPYPTPLSYYALNAAFIGLTNEFSEFYDRDPIIEQHYMFINLAIAAILLFSLVVVYRRSTDRSQLTAWLPISLLTYAGNLVLMEAASRIVGRSLFIPRSYTPLAVLMVIPLAYCVVKVPEAIITKAYQGAFMVLICVLLFLSSLYLYSNLYEVFTFYSPEPNTTNQMLTAINSRYAKGDQIVVVPFHFQDSLIKYFWRNEHPRINDILQSALLEGDEKKRTALLVQASGKRNIFIIVKQLFFLESNTHYSEEQRRAASDILKKVNLLCLSPEIQLVSNKEWAVMMCTGLIQAPH